MNETETFDVALERWRKRLTALLFFSTLLGFVYGLAWLLPFWMHFDVNVLQFLTAWDIFKHALPWILSSIFLFLVGWSTPSLSSRSKAAKPESMLRVTLKIYLALALMALLAYLLDFIAGMYLSMFSIVGYSLGFYMWDKLPSTSPLVTLLPTRVLGAVVIGLPVLLALILGTSQGRAEEATRGFSYKVVTLLSSKTKDWLPVSGPDDVRPRLIGQAGEYLFIYEPVTKSTVAIKLEGGDSYQVRRVTNRRSLW